MSATRRSEISSQVTSDLLGSATVPVGTVAGAGERHARRSLRKKMRRLAPLGWLGPSVILILGVIVYPAITMVLASLHTFDSFGVDHGFSGLANFRTLFAEPDFPHILWNTFIWVGSIVALTSVVSLALAQFLNAKFAGRRLVRWALIIPWASSLVMTSIIWRYIYDYQYGYLNRVLLDLGIIGKPIAWYEDSVTALPSLIFLGVVLSVPFTTYCLLAGLQSIPAEIYDAARVDGAGRWQTYRQLTLPLLRPAFTIACVLNIIYVFNAFPVIWTITSNIPGAVTDTSVTFMYKIAFKTNLDLGESAALSVLNVAFIMTVVTVVLWLLNRGEGTRHSTLTAVATDLLARFGKRFGLIAARRGSPRRTARPSAGSAMRHRTGTALWERMRRFVLPIVGFAIALFFLAPYIVMFISSLKSDNDLFASPAQYLPRHWEWSNWVNAFHYAPLAEYLEVSLLIAISGTIIVIAVAIPAAYYTARTRFRGRTTYLYAILVTQMFAPILLVIGLQREFLQLGLQDSIIAVVIADSAFNLAFAIWILNGYFSSVPVDLEEAGMLDGLSRLKAIRHIVIPVAKPGVVTAIIFTFISIWNEFVVALTLISSPNKEPLTVGIESFVGEYKTEYQYLFVASIIAIVPIVVLFSRIERHLVSGLTAGSVK